ncbi:pseudouridine-5'-phosphate glycosidase [Streptomyces purpurogeneiscleroticus]|uniref:pseudouridine-5'-phosphate glycosidase n=1 Tax=Streptomyces purpurogeneiscleroticus TaxID=68259 RepID=UPI001CBD3A56|nr:pseudouridine-5'-phosphate glycosidase [Streptomyces purpurogeneiscleroticus]MBZ4016755.1 pseudouridine-5-phosphate glycosidase [Streptomyces purpurogeneiscleroticus]
MTRQAAHLPAVSDEVHRALDAGRPVVALESTIFTHGLPRPRNLAIAREAEEILRAAGAVPATTGVVAGVPTVGLSDADIERLCTADDVAKASVRDLPGAIATGRDAGTTVAATAHLAHLAGVQVFATGGLGGVHHGARTSFDESADLVTLARTPVTVVSAGVKSVLDIGATLERLETLSIPVVGYRTRRFPGFYVADSGHGLDTSAESPEEIAAMIRARDALGLRSALLVANPVPRDRQLDPRLHERVLAEAWDAAAREGVSGAATTPFLLDHIRRATGGRSLDVNAEVYRNNVTVGAAIARAAAG